MTTTLTLNVVLLNEFPSHEKVIVPISSHGDRDNVQKQIVLVQYENQLLENGLCTLLQEMVVMCVLVIYFVVVA